MFLLFSFTLCLTAWSLSLTGFDVVPAIIDKMNTAGVKCYHPDNCPPDLNADILLLSVPTPLIKETQRLDMKVGSDCWYEKCFYLEIIAPW